MHPTRIAVFAAAIAAVALVAAPATAGERVVAVGDVHGAYDGLVSILQRAGVIDEDTRWIGGETTLVQTGDLTDRGLQVREALELMMRLQDEAAAAGGRVVVLLGNHETMNITGFVRDVNPDLYAEFVDRESEKRRKQALREFRTYWQRQSASAEGEKIRFSSEVKDRWLAAHPLGLIEYLEAMGPQGRYGAWLRSLPTAVMVDGVLFVHGGIGPLLRGMSIDEINARVAGEIATFDELKAYMVERGLVTHTAGFTSVVAAARRVDPPDPRLEPLAGIDDWFIISGDGPLWFRGSAKWDEQERGAEMDAILDSLGVERMVNAHSPRRTGRIETRFGGRVLLIDTGMLTSYYRGRPSALVVENGIFTAIYTDGEEEVVLDTTLADAA